VGENRLDVEKEVKDLKEEGLERGGVDRGNRERGARTTRVYHNKMGCNKIPAVFY